LDRKLKFCKVC